MFVLRIAAEMLNHILSVLGLEEVAWMSIVAVLLALHWHTLVDSLAIARS